MSARTRSCYAVDATFETHNHFYIFKPQSGATDGTSIGMEPVEWQLRLINNSGTIPIEFAVVTIDEEGNSVEVDASPFELTDTADATGPSSIEVTINTRNPQIKVTGSRQTGTGSIDCNALMKCFGPSPDTWLMTGSYTSADAAAS